MKKIKITTKALLFAAFMVFCISALFWTGCNNNSNNTPYQTDQQWLKAVISGGDGTNQSYEDNLMANENSDFNDSVAVSDNGSGPMDPIDSLSRWGRIVENVQVSINGTFSGDTMYSAAITRVITGHFRIIGYKNGQPEFSEQTLFRKLEQKCYFQTS